MITLMVAHDLNRGIGYEGKLLCNLKDDMDLFKKYTKGKMVVMGRSTFESLGSKPLPDRFNVVLTSTPMKSDYDNLIFVNNPNIIRFMSTIKNIDIFVIGGQQLYQEFYDDAYRLLVTEINHKFDKVDTYFPEYDKANYAHILCDQYQANERNDHDFTFNIYYKA